MGFQWVEVCKPSSSAPIPQESPSDRSVEPLKVLLTLDLKDCCYGSLICKSNEQQKSERKFFSL